MSSWLGYPSRTVLTLAAVLALAVLVAVLPVERTGVLTTGVAIVVVWLCLIAFCTQRRARTRRVSAPAIAQLHALAANLPLGVRVRMPLMLVTGDALAQIFGATDGEHQGLRDDRRVLISDGAIWLRVDGAQDLPRLAVAARQWRDGRAPDGVVLCVAPALYSDTDALRQNLFVIRQARSDAARMLRTTLPGFVAIYQRMTHRGGVHAETRDASWYGFASATMAAIAAERFDEAIRAAGDEVYRRHEPQSALHAAGRAASLASLIAWTRRVVLGALADARQPASPWALSGAGWIDCGPASELSNPWTIDVQARTTVAPVACDATPAPWPLPHPLIDAVPTRSWASPRLAALAHGLALVALAVALAVCGSARNNSALLNRIGIDLARFHMIPADHDKARRDALQPLIADRDELDRYGRVGVPLRLSFGMFRGAALIPALDAAIASYVPPPPSPSVVTLDSMSLFDSGKATLRPDSNRAMISALEMIKAHRGTRILIAGHTDNTGNPEANLKLSQARAAAVRDWLTDASGLPATQFAIQGYGDTRTVAGNDTPGGRAKNRRVEITLVPDSR